MTARFIKTASIAFLAIAAAPQIARAQDPIDITLIVPLQMQELPGNLKSIRVHCTVHPEHITVHLRSSDFGDASPVVNYAFSGTATVVLHLLPDQSVPAGTQWNYECHSEFVSNTVGPDGTNNIGTPGVSWAQLAPTSGPNLVQGTFTTQ